MVDLAGTALHVALFVIIPLLVGLLLGIDRKVTARLQNRLGPPIVQPFYDLVKLLKKQPIFLNSLQVVFAVATLMFQALAFGIFVSGGDLLIAFFISGAGAVSAAMGAFSAASPYAYIGGHRKLLTILAYEPVLFLIILAIGLRRSFIIEDISSGLLDLYPLAVLAIIPVLIILMEKSPYDIPTAHQELMTGPYAEYSGPYLGIMTIAHWFELAFVFGILSLFIILDNDLLSILAKGAIVVAAVFAAILIDNITARLTRERMLIFTLAFGMGLMGINVLVVYLLQIGVI